MIDALDAGPATALLALLTAVAVLATGGGRVRRRPRAVRDEVATSALEVTCTWQRVGRRLLHRSRAEARRTDELEWVEALAAELGAGRDPLSALIAASSVRARSSPSSAPVCPRAVAAARAGADVGPALLADGERSEIVRGVAACWEVAAGSGAGLGASLAVLADAARETERVRHELQAGLAEPRATAIVLAALPGIGLLLGSMLGAEPLRWLVGSRIGVLVLAAGLALEAFGAWWAWRIASSLESQL